MEAARNVKPAVSVVVPVGDADPVLDDQLGALLAQDVQQPYEIVLAVNTADADAQRMIAEMAARFASNLVRVVDASTTRGASHARNAGAAAARADLLAFCDADDICHGTWLSSLVSALGDADAVGGQLREFNSTGSVPTWRPPATPGALPTFMGVPYLVSANLGIHRVAFEAVHGFDETLTRCEDIALSWRLLHAGRSVVYQPDAVVDYRVRASIRQMLRQHYLYGIGMSQVLTRIGRPGDASGTGWQTLLRPNNQPGGLRSVVGIARKAAIGAGRLVGLAGERWRSRR